MYQKLVDAFSCLFFLLFLGMDIRLPLWAQASDYTSSAKTPVEKRQRQDSSFFPGSLLSQGEKKEVYPLNEKSKKQEGGENKEEGVSKKGYFKLFTVELPPIEVRVSTTRFKDTFFDSPRGITVVGKEVLEERMVRTPAEALRYEPGIWVQKTGHFGGAPILRGFIGNRVLYLFDGIRRNTAGLFAGPNSFLQNVDALDLEKIEVIRGPGSVLYGSDAIGGTINVITNKPPHFSKKLKIGGREYGRYGSVDEERSGRTELFMASPTFFGFVGGTRRSIGDVRGGKGIGIQRPSGWEEHDWEAQVDYLLAPSHRLEAFVQNFRRPLGRRFDFPSWRQTDARQLYGLRYFGEEIGFIDDLQGTGYYHNQRSFITTKFWDSDGRDKTAGGEVQATSRVGEAVKMVYGVHYHQDRITGSNAKAGTEIPPVTWRNPAVFVLSEWQATERLRIDVGARWDQFTLKSRVPSLSKLDKAIQQAINNGSFPSSALELNTTKNALTGGAGLVYGLTDHWNLVGHVGRAFRAANQADMLSFGQFTQGFGVPAGSLKPESSWTYEGGLKAQAEGTSGALTVFHTVLSDPMVQVPGTFGGKDFIDVNGNGVKDPREQVFIKKNLSGKIRVTGLELEGVYILPKAWSYRLIPSGRVSLLGNLTWTATSATDKNQLLGNGNGAIPLNGLLGLRWENSRQPEKRSTWLQGEVQMVGQFTKATSADLATDPAFRSNPPDKTSPLLRRDGAIPGYAVVNLRLGQKFSKQSTLTLDMENLLNKKYRDAYSRIDAPGFNIVMALDFRF